MANLLAQDFEDKVLAYKKELIVEQYDQLTTPQKRKFNRMYPSIFTDEHTNKYALSRAYSICASHALKNKEDKEKGKATKGTRVANSLLQQKRQRK